MAETNGQDGDNFFGFEEGVNNGDYQGHSSQGIERTMDKPERVERREADDLDYIAAQERSRRDKMDDISAAMQDIEREEQKYLDGRHRRTLDQELSEMDKNVAKEFEGIDGLKGVGKTSVFFYEMGRRVGLKLANPYVKKATKFRTKLEERADGVERKVSYFKSRLYTDRDEDPNADVRDKGLVAQAEHYKSVCRGIAQTLVSMKSIQREIEVQREETQQEIAKYTALSQEEPQEEEHRNRLSMYQSRLNKLDEDALKLAKERRRLGTKLKGRDMNYQVADVMKENYETVIMQGEEALMELDSSITMIGQYIREHEDAVTLGEFQKDMVGIQSYLEGANRAVSKFQTTTIRALDSNLTRMRQSPLMGENKAYLDGVKSTQSRMLAEEDQHVNDIIDRYT